MPNRKVPEPVYRAVVTDVRRAQQFIDDLHREWLGNIAAKELAQQLRIAARDVDEALQALGANALEDVLTLLGSAIMKLEKVARTELWPAIYCLTNVHRLLMEISPSSQQRAVRRRSTASASRPDLP